MFEGLVIESLTLSSTFSSTSMRKGPVCLGGPSVRTPLWTEGGPTVVLIGSSGEELCPSLGPVRQITLTIGSGITTYFGFICVSKWTF